MAASDRAGMQLRDRPEFRDKKKPLTGTAEMTVAEAVAAMSERNYGSIVVVDGDDRVIGVATERDVMKKIVNTGRDAKSVKVSEIMTSDPRLARETDDVVDWLRIMSNERFRRLPVVDDEGRITAVFTQGDFVSYTWPDLFYQAGNLMRASVGRNWALLLVGGGIMIYSILMVIVIQLT